MPSRMAYIAVRQIVGHDPAVSNGLVPLVVSDITGDKLITDRYAINQPA